VIKNNNTEKNYIEICKRQVLNRSVNEIYFNFQQIFGYFNEIIFKKVDIT